MQNFQKDLTRSDACSAAGEKGFCKRKLSPDNGWEKRQVSEQQDDDDSQRSKRWSSQTDWRSR